MVMNLKDAVCGMNHPAVWHKRVEVSGESATSLFRVEEDEDKGFPGTIYKYLWVCTSHLIRQQSSCRRSRNLLLAIESHLALRSY